MFQTVMVAAEWLNPQPLMQFVKDVKAKSVARGQRNRTIKELSQLSDKELNDIGINRGMIHSIAYEVYREALAEKGWV